MKKSIGALLTIAIGVLSVSVTPVGAAPSADPVGVPARALTMLSVDGSPGARGFSITIDPGQSANRRVVITNHTTNLRLTVRLEPVAASALQASWITLSDVVETLEPGAHAVVSARVLVPSNAVPGSVPMKVQARVERAALTADGSAVAGTPSVSLPIAIKVQGAPTAQVSIVNVQNVTEHGRDLLAIEFQNVGATAIGMQGRVRVSTTPPTSYPVDAHVAPLTNTIVRVAWVKPPGAKGVPVAVDTDNARGDQASWNGSVGAAPPTTTAEPAVQAASASASAQSPIKKRDPFVLGVLAAVALTVLWFLYETLRALRRRRKRRRTLREVGLTAARADAQPANLPVPAATPVAASSDQISAVAAQLGALVGAIEHLTARLDAVRTLPPAAPEAVAEPVPVRSAPIPAPPPPPATMPERTPARVRASAEPAVTPSPEEDVLRAFAAAASEPRSTLGDGYPYEWPTSEQLDRFVARRNAAAPDAG